MSVQANLLHRKAALLFIDVIHQDSPRLMGEAPEEEVRGAADFLNAHGWLHPPLIKHARMQDMEDSSSEVPRRADYCTYWFRKADDQLSPCTTIDPITGRAGLVGTQNIRNNESREGGLDYVVKNGTIIEAVENQPWSGEANVNVSIANWVKTQDSALLPKKRRLWFKVEPDPATKKLRAKGSGPASKVYELNYRECDHINSALSDEIDLAGAVVLPSSRKPKRCFEGQQPGHDGFRLTKQQAVELREVEDVSGVVFPYLNGTEMLSDKFKSEPRFIIDFGNRDLLQASAFPKTLNLIKSSVLPKWKEDASAEQNETGKSSGEHQKRLQTWWRLKRRRQDLLDAIHNLNRYMVCSRVTKRPIFAFVSSEIHPDSSLTCFAFADDFSFGILQSNTHWRWFIAKCSKLTERFRYTPDSVFDTFPWPQSPNTRQIEAVAEAGREVRRVRAEALSNLKGGLRALYRTLELPGKNPLKDAHAALDSAVLNAYGFPANGDLLSQLLTLNLEVARRIEAGETVTAPGVPPAYPNPASLVTADCIKPETG
jgi:hypothetical protein